jgi:hypothetical protein
MLATRTSNINIPASKNIITFSVDDLGGNRDLSCRDGGYDRGIRRIVDTNRRRTNTPGIHRSRTQNVNKAKLITGSHHLATDVDGFKIVRNTADMNG